MMIEVFKTNVNDRDQAAWLIEEIQVRFIHHLASFDLEDGDRILVVKCATGAVQASRIIEFLKSYNYCAEVLPED